MDDTEQDAAIRAAAAADAAAADAAEKKAAEEAAAAAAKPKAKKVYTVQWLSIDNRCTTKHRKNLNAREFTTKKEAHEFIDILEMAANIVNVKFDLQIKLN